MRPAPPQTSPASIRAGEGGGCPAGAERRRHRGETTEDEEGDATSNVVLKHPDTTVATYA